MKLMRECDESEVCRERALKKFDLSRDELREERYLSSNLTAKVAKIEEEMQEMRM